MAMEEKKMKGVARFGLLSLLFGSLLIIHMFLITRTHIPLASYIVKSQVKMYRFIVQKRFHHAFCFPQTHKTPTQCNCNSSGQHTQSFLLTPIISFQGPIS
jgi:hypothetical protein